MHFVVAWEVVTAQQNGVATDTVVAGRQFAADGTPLGPEAQIDSGVGTGGGDIVRVARNPSLVMDDQGGYLLVWEAYAGNPILGYLDVAGTDAAKIKAKALDIAAQQHLGDHVQHAVIHATAVLWVRMAKNRGGIYALIRLV